MFYDPNNIFASIIRGEIPCNKVYEDPYTIGFHDVTPRAPIHVLVIPKGAYLRFSDFVVRAHAEEIASFFQAIGKIANEFGLQEDGYRLITNNGDHASQEVPHFHVHILGGAPLGPMVSSIENMKRVPGI